MTAERNSPPCRVCGSLEVAGWLRPREMMFGMRDEFAYFKCAQCGCLQISEVPANLSKYYPENYYSYQSRPNDAVSRKRRIKQKFLSPHMTRHLLGWKSALGSMFCKLASPPHIPPWLSFLTRPIAFDSPILDVGCGSGLHLLRLRDCGFTNLKGIDPFLQEPLTYSGGVRVEKSRLEDMGGSFSLVMFHHVFEHVEDPLVTLLEARRVLSKTGQILIRIPLSDSAAAQKYQEKWVQLDAPRHVTLQTRKSMSVLAEKAGLKITRVAYDSTDIQFWGSEQYERSIPLFDPRSYYNTKPGDIFTPDQIKAFAAESDRLNKSEKGDQAAFVLEPFGS